LRATRRIDALPTVRDMPCRRPFILAAVVVGIALSLLAAGCGGGGSPGIASVASSTTAAPSNGALAFAQCLRAHGLPKWPDPTTSGVFDKAELQQTGYSVSQIRAVEDGPCNHLASAAAPQRPTITAADRGDYLRAAACMRSHGLGGFPDPTFPNNSVQTNIPSSIDQDSSQFKSAATICTRLIPAGLPYSKPSGS
jgi:hypothetical protein